MRLLFVIDHLGTGGAQRQLASLALQLHGRGHEIDFFLYHDADFFGSRLREAGIRTFLHAKIPRRSFGPIFALRRRMKQGRYQAVLSFQSVPSCYAILARTLLRVRPRLVVSERTCPRTFDNSRTTKFIIQRLYRFVDCITVNSHYLSDYYSQTYPWMRGRIRTIWNGIELDHFRATPIPQRTNDTLRLLAVGRIIQYKNAFCLVRALSILRRRYGIRAHVDWAGRLHHLTAQEAEHLEALKDTICEEQLTDQWNWLGERSDIASLLKQHHALVHPSYRESLPNVVCEAIASGRPVIVSDTVEHPRLVQDGETGFLFDWEDPEQLAGTIHKFYRLPDPDMQEMGRKARLFAEQHLSVARMADDYESLFKDLVSQSQ